MRMYYFNGTEIINVGGLNVNWWIIGGGALFIIIIGYLIRIITIKKQNKGDKSEN